MNTDDLTLEQAADELGLEPSTLRHQIRNGRIRAGKVGHLWLISRAEIERYRLENLGRTGNRFTTKETSA